MVNGIAAGVALIRMMTDVLVSKESDNQRSSHEAVGISGGGAEFQIFGFVKRVWLLVVCTVQIINILPINGISAAVFQR